MFCSRSSVYRTVRTYRAGRLALVPDDHGRISPPVRTTVLVPTLRWSLLALLKAPPRVYGWCRTRWSGATLAATLRTTRGITVSAETLRRWVHETGWVWNRANLVAKDDDPQRVDRLARVRFADERLQPCEALVFADELDIHLLPKAGYAWMPQGSQVEVMTPGQNQKAALELACMLDVAGQVAVMTPGQNQKHDLAGALELTTGTLHHWVGPHSVFCDWLELTPRVSAAQLHNILEIRACTGPPPAPAPGSPLVISVPRPHPR